MTRRLLLSLLSFIVVAVCVATPFIPETAQPFDGVGIRNTNLALQVLPSSVGLQMPDGLKAGDLIYLKDMAPNTRAYFMVGSLNPPEGTAMELPVRRADGIHMVHAEFQRVPFLNGSLATKVNELVSYALLLFTAALGLLLAWRGHSRAAAGVAIWCFAGIYQQLVVPLFMVPMPFALYMGWSGQIIDNAGTLVGLYMVADDLTAQARPLQRRRLSTAAMAATVLAYAAGVMYFNWIVYQTAQVENPFFVVGLHFGGFAISLAILVFCYARCTPINQARIRWVGMSVVVLLAAYTFGQLPGTSSWPPLVVNVVVTVLNAVALVCFAYAVLKHQLVSLQVVMNRALVYGLMTSLVVGVVAAMLSFLEHETLNTETNRLLALFVPLILGMGLDSIKRQVNAYIGKIFFRRRHQSEAALAQFARSSGHVDDPEKLLDLTADELFRHSGPQGMAIYLTAPGTAGATLARQRGTLTFPKKVDSNDLAFLRLKAGDMELDLRGVSSALGTEGNIYALSIRNQVLGFIVLGPRPAESYTAEERRLFELVAHQVGVALHSLRLEEQRKLLEELAGGSFNSLPTAQAKARELIGALG